MYHHVPSCTIIKCTQYACYSHHRSATWNTPIHFSGEYDLVSTNASARHLQPLIPQPQRKSWYPVRSHLPFTSATSGCNVLFAPLPWGEIFETETNGLLIVPFNRKKTTARVLTKSPTRAMAEWKKISKLRAKEFAIMSSHHQRMWGKGQRRRNRQRSQNKLSLIQMFDLSCSCASRYHQIGWILGEKNQTAFDFDQNLGTQCSLKLNS